MTASPPREAPADVATAEGAPSPSGARDGEAPLPRSLARRAVRPLLLVAGLAVAAFVVHRVGPKEVLRVLRDAGAWLPLVALLEVGFVATDILALRLLLGNRKRLVTRTHWVRSTAVAYASTILLPTGRAAGEAARAAVLSEDLGVGFAASTCARLQAVFLVGNGGVSLLIAGALFAWRRDVTTALALAMLGNAATCLVLGTVILSILRGARLSVWIEKRLPWLSRKFKQPGRNGAQGGDQPTRARLVGCMALCLLGRLAQTAQFAVVMRAVGGAFTVPAAMTAQAVQIVGSTVGDIFPAQVGASEGSYYACAGMLGLGSDPARALSIRILVLTAELGLAVGCIVVAAVFRQRRAPARS